jgi:hypothetical protein
MEKNFFEHIADNAASHKRIWDRIDENRKSSLWAKVPEKILAWAVPLLMGAILWAFMNGWGGK